MNHAMCKPLFGKQESLESILLHYPIRDLLREELSLS